MELESFQEKNAYVEHFLESNLTNISRDKLDVAMKKLHKKPVMLVEESMSKVKKNKKHEKRLQSKRLIKLKNSKYADFEPLRSMWKQYIKVLLGIEEKKSVNIKEMQEILLKADYHGATVKVAKSKCNSMQGLCGTVVTESKNMFQVVTIHDKIIKIPKKHSIFEIECLNHRITIFGDQFCIKPGFRLTKKFGKYVSTLAVV